MIKNNNELRLDPKEIIAQLKNIKKSPSTERNEKTEK